MVVTVAIDASTYVGSVAVLDGGRVVAESDVAMRGRDEERLMPAVSDALKRSGRALSAVDRIVCGGGPGSFTSLRIAAAIAKGMALGADKPLFAVSSLALIVAGNVATSGATTARYLAALDAMRDEYFVAPFEHRAGELHVAGAPRLIAKADVAVVAAAERATVVGPDFGERWAPRARGVVLLEAMMQKDGAVTLSDWEPTYGRLAEAQAKWEAAFGALPR
jgi:tRNA threonylcarbamoyladenosine biosynthesis protein TsaB